MCDARWAVDERAPGAEGRGDDRIVDDVVDDPLHARRLEHEDDLGRGQVSGVAVHSQLLGIEGRAGAKELFCLGMHSVPQVRHDQQPVHRFLPLRFFRS